jgi:Transglycosylase SLT domain
VDARIVLLMRSARWLSGILAVAAGCASTSALGTAAPRAASAQPVGAPGQAGGARFWLDPRLPLGHPPADSLVNDNGSPRITNPADYDRFWRDLAPRLSEWAADPRLRLNPNFVAALMAKESGFDPRATSDMPANGIAQMTHIADLDLRIISREAPAFRWMHDEVSRWPRVAAVHDSAARKSRTDSLLASGAVGARTEYLFDPRLALRGSLFWLRILASVWTEDEWPGQHAALARGKLARGGPLSESDLLALVTVSYNQGHPYVADLVSRHGRDWTRHLNAESADYLERITRYTWIFQRAASGR